MTYLRQIADEIRLRIGDAEFTDYDAAPLFDLYAVLALAKGVDTTARDVHDVWVAWMLARGTSHPAMVPYDELSPEVQAADEPFAEAIRAVARSADG